MDNITEGLSNLNVTVQTGFQNMESRLDTIGTDVIGMTQQSNQQQQQQQQHPDWSNLIDLRNLLARLRISIFMIIF